MRPPSERRTAGWIIFAICLVGLFWFVGIRRVSLIEAADAPLSKPLRMVDATSETFSLSDYRGRVVLLSLWADWCPPCKRESPALSRLQSELGPQGLSIVGLNADSLGSDALSRIGDAWRVDYRIASASDGGEGGYLDRGQIPHHWFIDREGRIRGEKSGAIPLRSLRRTLRSLLEEASDAAP